MQRIISHALSVFQNEALKTAPIFVPKYDTLCVLEMFTYLDQTTLLLPSN